MRTKACVCVCVCVHVRARARMCMCVRTCACQLFFLTCCLTCQDALMISKLDELSFDRAPRGTKVVCIEHMLGHLHMDEHLVTDKMLWSLLRFWRPRRPPQIGGTPSQTLFFYVLCSTTGLLPCTSRHSFDHFESLSRPHLGLVDCFIPTLFPCDNSVMGYEFGFRVSLAIIGNSTLHVLFSTNVSSISATGIMPFIAMQIMPFLSRIASSAAKRPSARQPSTLQAVHVPS